MLSMSNNLDVQLKNYPSSKILFYFQGCECQNRHDFDSHARCVTNSKSVRNASFARGAADVAGNLTLAVGPIVENNCDSEAVAAEGLTMIRFEHGTRRLPHYGPQKKYRTGALGQTGQLIPRCHATPNQRPSYFCSTEFVSQTLIDDDACEIVRNMSGKSNKIKRGSINSLLYCIIYAIL